MALAIPKKIDWTSGECYRGPRGILWNAIQQNQCHPPCKMSWHQNPGHILILSKEVDCALFVTMWNMTAVPCWAPSSLGVTQVICGVLGRWGPEVIESQSGYGWRGPWRLSVSNPALWAGCPHQLWLSRSPSNLDLGTSRDEASLNNLHHLQYSWCFLACVV